MDEEVLDKAVYLYLKKKGFTQTEQIFQQEQQNKNKNSSSSVTATDVSLSDPDLAKQILVFSQYYIYHFTLSSHLPQLSINYLVIIMHSSKGSCFQVRKYPNTIP